MDMWCLKNQSGDVKLDIKFTAKLTLWMLRNLCSIIEDARAFEGEEEAWEKVLDDLDKMARSMCLSDK